MIQGIKIFPLKQISLEKGDVWHGLKNSDEGFEGFGEVYFSNVNPGQIKGWKKHLETTLNLIVLKGEIEFVFYDDRIDSETNGTFFSVIASEVKEKYARVSVSPGIWMAFRCLSKEQALLMDVIDQPHSDNESLRKELEEINYNW
jgi:dTDP-4-dehydrorhamnose 3,5-epimerase